MGAPRNSIIAIATTLITLSLPLTATAIPLGQNTHPLQLAGPVKDKPRPAAQPPTAPPYQERLSETEQQEVEALFDDIEQALEDLENNPEASNLSSLAKIETFIDHLATCSPYVGENLFFRGHNETIHGWEGDRCRIDKTFSFGEVTQRERCLYTRRDIALITGATPYTPDDTAAPQCTKLKPDVRNND
ncbi:MAG: hypothetical protein AB8B99_03565 [Phormidesmis sp.]